MKNYPILFLLVLPVAGLGQSLPDRVVQHADLAVATKGSVSTVALSANRLHGLGQRRRFRLGYGLRITSAFGRDTDYKTAPSRLVKGPGRGSALGLFSPDIDANIDTLRLPQTRATSINISLNLEHALSRRLGLGFNIDVFGATLGRRQRGTFIANSPTRSPLSGTVQEARLTPINVLYGDRSDQGSLNSQGYVRYQLTPGFSLRGGFQFQFNEYTTDQPLTFGNDRFRSSNLGAMLAASWHF